MAEFLSRPISVQLSADGSREPAEFTADGETYRVVEIQSMWQDYGFGGTHPAARTWRTRRHRNYYRLRCDDGHTYEIYLDRASKRREWYLYRRID
ncbi:MAG: hypothetical protein BWY85_01607 [Firmicutes bacterium ADurb.Bin506]|jgi:hypothetical protein|nr:MAG: hypothetical protein BWY85_01607 [Firmicutes bacterium ADurb.Bin506]